MKDDFIDQKAKNKQKNFFSKDLLNTMRDFSNSKSSIKKGIKDYKE
jgi:hypothetical protein